MTDRVLILLMTRDECLEWAKARALEYLPRDPTLAVTLFQYELGRHPELADHPAIRMAGMLIVEGTLNDAEQVRAFIEGQK